MSSHCFHWTRNGEQCCDCGLLDPDGSQWGRGGCPGGPSPWPDDDTTRQLYGHAGNKILMLRHR